MTLDLDEITKEELSDFLKFMRKSVNMTQINFAKAIGIAQNQYSRWENGQFKPRNVDAVIEKVRNLVKEIKRSAKTESLEVN